MELARLRATRDDLEYKLKINKTEQSEFISRSDAQIKYFSKTLKIKDKEIYDLKRNLDNSRDTNENLKIKGTQVGCENKKLLKKLCRSEVKKERFSTSSQTVSTVDVPYHVPQPLFPIFVQAKPVVMTKSLPDLKTMVQVIITQDDKLQEAAEEALNAQYDYEQEDDVIKCKVCGLVFKSQQELEDHDKAYTFCCWQCSICYGTIKEAQDHLCQKKTVLYIYV